MAVMGLMVQQLVGMGPIWIDQMPVRVYCLYDSRRERGQRQGQRGGGTH